MQGHTGLCSFRLLDVGRGAKLLYRAEKRIADEKPPNVTGSI